jgi:hypothetical protein
MSKKEMKNDVCFYVTFEENHPGNVQPAGELVSAVTILEGPKSFKEKGLEDMWYIASVRSLSAQQMQPATP